MAKTLFEETEQTKKYTHQICLMNKGSPWPNNCDSNEGSEVLREGTSHAVQGQEMRLRSEQLG